MNLVVSLLMMFRRDFPYCDPATRSLLHLQRCVSLHHDVSPDVAGVRFAAGQWGKNCLRCHRVARLLRVHAGHRGETAGNLRFYTANRYCVIPLR